jgi:Domain of unknown function (DUF5655)/Domain of unknown function (DUF4287)
MADPQKAIETQLANIEKRTGKSLSELTDRLRSSGLAKHGELRDFAKRELALGYGDANTLTHYFLDQANAAPAPSEKSAGDMDVLAEIYTGPKAALRPIHDALKREIDPFGPYETAPKKGYVSLRRKKQFATIGPATNTRVEVGLNMKDVPATDRLLAIPPGGMCNYKIKLSTAAEVDPELIAWIRRAYDSAG